MTDFKKLLENGCLVEIHINYIEHLNDNAYAVLSILTTHPAEIEFDNFDSISSYNMDIKTLVALSQLNEQEVLEALKNLEDRGYIESGNFENIIVYLKPYDLNDCNSIR